jgi:hypothetical protein
MPQRGVPFYKQDAPKRSAFFQTGCPKEECLYPNTMPQRGVPYSKQDAPKRSAFIPAACPKEECLIPNRMPQRGVPFSKQDAPKRSAFFQTGWHYQDGPYQTRINPIPDEIDIRMALIKRESIPSQMRLISKQPASMTIIENKCISELF